MATKKYVEQRKKAASAFIDEHIDHLRIKYREGISMSGLCDYVADYVCCHKSQATRISVVKHCRIVLQEQIDTA